MKEGGWRGVTVGECLEMGGVGQGEAGWYRVAEDEAEKRQREGVERSEMVNGTAQSGHKSTESEGADKVSDAMRRWKMWGLGSWMAVAVVVVGWVVVGI